MRITDETLDEFMEICRDELGEEVTRSEAREMAFRLVTLYETLSRGLPGDAQPPAPAEHPPRQAQAIGFRA